MLKLQAVTPKGKLRKIRANDDVFVYGNNGAADFMVSSAALRASDAIAKEDFWKTFNGVNESTDLFLVLARHTVKYEKLNDVGKR